MLAVRKCGADSVGAVDRKEHDMFDLLKSKARTLGLALVLGATAAVPAQAGDRDA